MAVTPDPSDVITFEINANPSQTTLALSKRTHPTSHSSTDVLPGIVDVQHLTSADSQAARLLEGPN